MERRGTGLSPIRKVALTVALVSLALGLLCSARGGELVLIAGDIGDAGVVDGPAAVARLGSLAGVTVDAAGIVYVSDGHAIRRILPDGSVTTLAGRVGELGDRDGPGAIARFNNPQGVAADATGNVYVADRDNHTIRKISPEGIVSTFAGQPTPGARRRPQSTDGTGTGAEFSGPIAITVDDGGNLYVADGNTIRKITTGRVVTTVAGVAEAAGIRLGPLPGLLQNTSGLALIDAHTLVATERFSVLKIRLNDRQGPKWGGSSGLRFGIEAKRCGAPR